MRFLYDAVLPENLAEEAPVGVTLHRWKGADEQDAALIRIAADRGYRGVLFFGRNSLEQRVLREIARKVGVVLVAVDADDPIDAKGRVLHNFSRLRRMMADHDCLLILAREVRGYPG